MHRYVLILAVFLSCWYPLLCIRVTMGINDAIVSSRSCNWVIAELIFHGLALALVWISIIMK